MSFNILLIVCGEKISCLCTSVDNNCVNLEWVGERRATKIPGNRCCAAPRLRGRSESTTGRRTSRSRARLWRRRTAGEVADHAAGRPGRRTNQTTAWQRWWEPTEVEATANRRSTLAVAAAVVRRPNKRKGWLKIPSGTERKKFICGEEQNLETPWLWYHVQVWIIIVLTLSRLTWHSLYIVFYTGLWLLIDYSILLHILLSNSLDGFHSCLVLYSSLLKS